ncbi:RICIN domain-containing protein [Embleya sp. MST-111070]|uniref:RICIN domain-containing protein n=1 Tax=Embleya sp. MST-111070 TaxID=3398231 RepID=UPI003F7322EB
MRKPFRGLRIVAVALATLFAVAAPPADAGTYTLKIRNQGTGLCLGPERGAPVVWDNVVQVDCGSGHTTWQVEEVGMYMVMWLRLRHPENPAWCITAGATAGNPNFLALCETEQSASNYQSQLWAFVPEGDKFQLKVASNYNCMGIQGGSTLPGTKSITWGCGPWNDHFWYLQP